MTEELAPLPAREELDQLLRDITHEEHELLVLDKQYRAMIAPHQTRLRELKEQFEPLAESYARHQLGLGIKTSTLWHGTLRMRKSQPKVLCTSQIAAIDAFEKEWGYDRTMFVQQRDVINQRELNQLILRHAESGNDLPEGIAIIPPSDSFSYQTPTPKITDILEEE